MTEIQGSPQGQRSPALVNINEHMANSITVTTNLHTEVVVTTKDKISNALFQVLPKFRRRNGWVAPATLLSSLVIALLSTDFNQKLFGLSAETWKAIFTIAAGVSAVWLIWALAAAIFFSANHRRVVEAIVKTHANDSSAPLQGKILNDS